MAQPTTEDVNNAYVYAAAKIMHEIYEKNYHAFSSNDVYWQNHDVNYFCPKGLNCLNGQMEFSKTGCLNTSCFPYDSMGEPLHPITNKPKTISPYCFDKFKKWTEKSPIPDTQYHEWDNEKQVCRAVVPFLKRWSEYPHTRRPEREIGVTDVPPFNYINHNTVIITQDYCDRMGIPYVQEQNDCIPSVGQQIAEIFMGTLYREL
ncbi:hypothetical protein PV326_003167 [Microctonus aethiopoides]|nr:hypothetical protein PV326_003167 [Microctonus aethiopoides]